MKLAPALAAIHACTGEKHSVTLTMVPSLASAAQAFNPSQVSGTFTAMFLAILVSTAASRIMPS